MTRRVPQLLPILAFYIMWLNPLHGLLKKWSLALPEGWYLLPYLINFLITMAAFYFIHRYSPNYKKSTFWIVLVLVSAAALVSYLWW